MLNQDEKFYDKVLFIKRQLVIPLHPIRDIIERLKEMFIEHSMVLLCKQSDPIAKEVLSEATFEEKMNYAKESLIRVINIIVEAVLIFYNLDTQIKPHDLKRELFINLVTNIVLEGELYFLIFNLISNCFATDL